MLNDIQHTNDVTLIIPIDDHKILYYFVVRNAIHQFFSFVVGVVVDDNDDAAAGVSVGEFVGLTVGDAVALDLSSMLPSSLRLLLRVTPRTIAIIIKMTTPIAIFGIAGFFSSSSTTSAMVVSRRILSLISSSFLCTVYLSQYLHQMMMLSPVCRY